jgi:hypothetical protein
MCLVGKITGLGTNAGYSGSTTPLVRYLRTVLRENPVRRDISRMLIPSLRCHRLITLNNATLITPVSPAQCGAGQFDYVGQIWMQFNRCRLVRWKASFDAFFAITLQFNP